MNELGGFRNDLSVAPHRPRHRGQGRARRGGLLGGVPVRARATSPASRTRVVRTDKVDPATNEEAVALWRITRQGSRRAQGRPGRRRTPSIELALATIPGFFGVGGGPARPSPTACTARRSSRPSSCPSTSCVLGGDADGGRLGRARRRRSRSTPAAGPDRAARPAAPTRRGAARPRGRRPLGRQGRQRQPRRVRPQRPRRGPGSTAFLTVERLRALLPEARRPRGRAPRLPNLWSLNFVIHGLLQEGVAASTRQDGQAKSLGEWLRARVVDLPAALVGCHERGDDVPAPARSGAAAGPCRPRGRCSRRDDRAGSPTGSARSSTSSGRSFARRLRRPHHGRDRGPARTARCARSTGWRRAGTSWCSPWSTAPAGGSAATAIGAPSSPTWRRSMPLRAYLSAATVAVSRTTEAYARDLAAMPAAQRRNGDHADYVVAVTRTPARPRRGARRHRAPSTPRPSPTCIASLGQDFVRARGDGHAALVAQGGGRRGRRHHPARPRLTPVRTSAVTYVRMRTNRLADVGGGQGRGAGDVPEVVLDVVEVVASDRLDGERGAVAAAARCAPSRRRTRPRSGRTAASRPPPAPPRPGGVLLPVAVGDGRGVLVPVLEERVVLGEHRRRRGGVEAEHVADVAGVLERRPRASGAAGRTSGPASNAAQWRMPRCARRRSSRRPGEASKPQSGQRGRAPTSSPCRRARSACAET